MPGFVVRFLVGALRERWDIVDCENCHGDRGGRGGAAGSGGDVLSGISEFVWTDVIGCWRIRHAGGCEAYGTMGRLCHGDDVLGLASRWRGRVIGEDVNGRGVRILGNANGIV